MAAITLASTGGCFLSHPRHTREAGPDGGEFDREDGGSVGVDAGRVADGGDAGRRDAGSPDGGGSGCDLGTREHCSSCGDHCSWMRCRDGQCADPIQVVVGREHSCALRRDATVVCWGDNARGQLGNGRSGLRSATPLEVRVSGGTVLEGAVLLAGGYKHTCALRNDSSVWCWGSSEYGELGNGMSGPEALSPVAMPVLHRDATAFSGISAIAAKGNYTCALEADSARVWCWGANFNGELGFAPDGASHEAPIEVPGMADAVAIAAGYNHACALRADGSVWCWGYGRDGQLGNGSAAWAPASPVLSASPGTGVLDGVTAIACGGTHTCALRSGAGAELLCWGGNHLGQLGNDRRGESALRPVIANRFTVPARAFALGYSTTCVAALDGTLSCVGAGSEGQLGDGGNTSSAMPVRAELIDVLQIDISQWHVCAVTDAREAWCWGSNSHGQVGDGDPSDLDRLRPTLVASP
ncbi:RCC1 domain-containing protein [Sandaracinus amylolyticus]|uniref:RCC1 domain-containing protein n=1 Tax=Sandaracinus TaxID=1055688 RepID=UPI003AF3881C|nr:Hypothetical protein I5071_1210 [Sandaracinus amylolyticus]